MRFVLDADVDEAGCIRVLTKAHHQVFTARAARVEHDDWDVHAYALSQRAAVVAKDQAFMANQRRKKTGQHIRLKCADPRQAELLEAALDVIVEYCKKHTDLTIVASPKAVKVWIHEWDVHESVAITLPSDRRKKGPTPGERRRRGGRH
jgi:predicted nuclease of predicted toxin-antitoxin system